MLPKLAPRGGASIFFWRPATECQPYLGRLRKVTEGCGEYLDCGDASPLSKRRHVCALPRPAAEIQSREAGRRARSTRVWFAALPIQLKMQKGKGQKPEDGSQRTEGGSGRAAKICGCAGALTFFRGRQRSASPTPVRPAANGKAGLCQPPPGQGIAGR
jgi:hypothetical protein